ncbi:hypothetical protein LCGC14_0393060 [marine sediment metagenome]|uniref:Uncharacterized protein n=1 Tax=marine sediment metagenome TaxID=412755 RepID=A0A0F9SZ38_9ZZZZ
MYKLIVKTEVGALPYDAEKHNQLVLDSVLRQHPKDRDDMADAKSIVDWMDRYIPALLYSEIARQMRDSI